MVEVCLALGIIAFAVLPVVGLLSIGLQTYRNTVARDRATQVLTQIGASLSLAKTVTDASGKPTATFTAAAPYQYTVSPASPNPYAITWQWDQSQAMPSPSLLSFLFYLDENGALISTNSSAPPARMAALVLIKTPSSQFDPGSAQIVVAWPATSTPTNTSNGVTFSNAEGHVETIVSLLPTGL